MLVVWTGEGGGGKFVTTGPELGDGDGARGLPSPWMISGPDRTGSGVDEACTGEPTSRTVELPALSVTVTRSNPVQSEGSGQRNWSGAPAAASACQARSGVWYSALMSVASGLLSRTETRTMSSPEVRAAAGG